MEFRASFCVTGARLPTPFHPRGMQARYFVHIAKTLARWFQTSCFVACAVFGELDNVLKGSKISFCETVVIFDLVHDDDFAWQALRMPETNFLWLYSRDLDEKLVETM